MIQALLPAQNARELGESPFAKGFPPLLLSGGSFEGCSFCGRGQDGWQAAQGGHALRFFGLVGLFGGRQCCRRRCLARSTFATGNVQLLRNKGRAFFLALGAGYAILAAPAALGIHVPLPDCQLLRHFSAFALTVRAHDTTRHKARKSVVRFSQPRRFFLKRGCLASSL